MKWFKSKAIKQREAIMAQVRQATAQGQCVILAEVKGVGTRVMVLGKDILSRQLDEIQAEQG